MLRHFLASIAYRTQKAIKDAPKSYFNFRALPGLRTPHELLFHMTSVLGYARTHFIGGHWRPEKEDSFQNEIDRFHEILDSLKAHLEKSSSFINTTPERMLQGPFSDAMTHAGQLAMLRRFHGSPIPPENFIVADIDPENVGQNQSAPVDPDEIWLDAEGRNEK